MELKPAMLEGQGTAWEDTLCHDICSDAHLFNQLMEYFYSGDFQLSHRATLIILRVAKEQPAWVANQVPRMVNTLNAELPVWYKRNLLRILQYQDIPQSHWGHAADQCFNYLSSSEQPVAIKVFSITVLYNICRHLPDLARELRLLIEEQYPIGSAGFKARGRKVLQQLDKDGL